MKEDGVTSLKFVCLLAAPRDSRRWPGNTGRAGHHRRDRQPPLNDHGYIVPGLGDAGDRIFGTQ